MRQAKSVMHNVMLSREETGTYRLQLDREDYDLTWDQLVLLVHCGVYLVLRDGEPPKK